MRTIAATPLDIHGDDDVRAERAPQPDIVADNLLTAPLPDDFLRVERVAVIDGARKVLLGSIDAVRREQLGRAQDRDIAEQLWADFVLAAIAAVVLHVDHAQPHAVSEEREERVGFVVRVRGRLQEGGRNAQLAQGQAERNVTVVGRCLREAHAVLGVNRHQAGSDYKGRGQQASACREGQRQSRFRGVHRYFGSITGIFTLHCASKNRAKGNLRLPRTRRGSDLAERRRSHG